MTKSVAQLLGVEDVEVNATRNAAAKPANAAMRAHAADVLAGMKFKSVALNATGRAWKARFSIPSAGKNRTMEVGNATFDAAYVEGEDVLRLIPRALMYELYSREEKPSVKPSQARFARSRWTTEIMWTANANARLAGSELQKVSTELWEGLKEAGIGGSLLEQYRMHADMAVLLAIVDLGLYPEMEKAAAAVRALDGNAVRAAHAFKGMRKSLKSLLRDLLSAGASREELQAMMDEAIAAAVHES